MDVEDRELQMKALAELTRVVDERGIHVELVADEWCNTLDDIKYFADHKAGHMVQMELRTRAVSTTLPKQSSTVRKKALALTRAVPATRPTDLHRFASTLQWQYSLIRFWQNPAWVLMKKWGI